MFCLVHKSFPDAFVFDDSMGKLLDSSSMRIANRKFRESAIGFEDGRRAFIDATLASPRLNDDALRKHSRINFEGAYNSREFKELEFDFIVKLPVFEGCEWTRDATAGESAPFFISPTGVEQLPPRPSPSVPARPVRLPASSTNTSFSDSYYPPDSSAYVVAEVYAPLGSKSSQMSQKLLQAERSLQFLKAKERKESVRDCVLGFVFICPRMDATMVMELADVLRCYSSVLPCLSELQKHPCRLLGFQTSFQPALAALGSTVAVEKLGQQIAEVKEQIAELKEELLKARSCTIQ